MDNILYYGDNLDILKRYVKDESVDLVYLDPPFNSKATYNVLFKEKDGTEAASQIRAFDDTWTWGSDDEAVFNEIQLAGGKVADCLGAFRLFLGACDMLSYLVMMAPRLIELRRVMKPTASIYLHCDPTASHYLKLLMDAIFGIENFRNEIVWHYRRWTNEQTQFQKMHDIILFYRHGKGTFNLTGIAPTESQAAVIERGWNVNKVKDRNGKVLQLLVYNQEKVDAAVKAGKLDLSRYGRIVDRTAIRLSAASDTWTDIQYLHSQALERLGYPTQKPVTLLERIIQASSNEYDVVLDPFCGCGTTIAAAQSLKRNWIGIDITYLALSLMKNRLREHFGDAVKFKVIGEPASVPDAARLAETDPYQFQYWALGLVNARPEEQKKGADKGIDGKIIFMGDKQGAYESVIISVKAGKTGAAHVRDLIGVIDREKAAIGVLISMQEPTGPMKTEAAMAGFYKNEMWKQKQYQRVQLLTIADLFAGKTIDMPPIRQVNSTFKKAPKVEEKEKEQKKLFVG